MVWDALSNALVSFAVGVVELFPASPFVILDEMSNSEFYEWLQMMNWFIPIRYYPVTHMA